MDQTIRQVALEEFLKTPIGRKVPPLTRLIASKLDRGEAPEVIARALGISTNLVNSHIKIIQRFPCRSLDEKLMEEEQEEEDLEQERAEAAPHKLVAAGYKQAPVDSWKPGRFQQEMERWRRLERAEEQRQENELQAAARSGDTATINRLLPLSPSAGDVLVRALSLQPQHENEGPEYDGPARSMRARGNRSILNLRKQRPSTAPEIVDDAERRAVLSEFMKTLASKGMRKKELKGIRLYCEKNSPETVAGMLCTHRTTVNRWLLKAEKLAKSGEQNKPK